MSDSLSIDVSREKARKALTDFINTPNISPSLKKDMEYWLSQCR